MADERRTPLTNLAWKGLSLSLDKGMRLLVVALATRVLGVASFGRFQFAVTVTTMLALGTDLGLGIWTTRALARDRARAGALVGTTLGLRLLAAGPYAVITLLVALAVGPGETRSALLFLGVAALATAFVDHFGAILRGYERLDDEGRMNITSAALVAACSLGALAWGRSVAAISAGAMVGALGGAGYGLFILRRHYGLPALAARAAFDRALARTARAQALPLWLASLLSLLYFRGDVVLLRLIAGDAELGAYSAAYKPFEGCMALPAVLLAALFPRLARAHGDHQRQRGLERRVVATLVACGVVVGAAFTFAPAEIIRIVAGPGFSRAVPSLRVLALGVPLLYCNYGLTHFLIARDLGSRNLAFTAMMLVLNVGLNLLVIPRWGGPGAAFATVATEAALTACCLAALGARPARATSLPTAQPATSRAHMSG
jgi:O-antigen/teichoic acid export membrane protein